MLRNRGNVPWKSEVYRNLSKTDWFKIVKNWLTKHFVQTLQRKLLCIVCKPVVIEKAPFYHVLSKIVFHKLSNSLEIPFSSAFFRIFILRKKRKIKRVHDIFMKKKHFTKSFVSLALLLFLKWMLIVFPRESDGRQFLTIEGLFKNREIWL